MGVQIEYILGDPRARTGEPKLLDVREPPEWHKGRIPASMHAPYHDISAIPESIDPGRPVAVVTAGGAGHRERAGHPVERSG